MEKYTVSSTAHSIVEPDMRDVGVTKNGHFVKAFRVSNNLHNAVPGAECIMHHNIAGAPIAYCFGDEMYIVNVPRNRIDAIRQMALMAGLMRGSLDTFRFYIALRTAMRHHGLKPSLFAADNMLRLAAMQMARRER